LSGGKAVAFIGRILTKDQFCYAWQLLEMLLQIFGMKILFLGGTGVISTACTALALEHHWDVTLVNRGRKSVQFSDTVKILRGDLDDSALSDQLAGASFDAVVDFIAFTPADIERDLRLFRGRTRQFVFISSASAYQKPLAHYRITEATPLSNPYWEYSRNKIVCEERLIRAYREEGFPVTIVRPSLTYGETLIPLVLNSWEKSYTAVDRMLRGQKVIVPGDGSSLWVITHNTDFAKGLVGLLGQEEAIGEAFHITSDEVLTWNQLFEIVGEAVGVEPQIVHIASDFLAACCPDKLGTLTGDKSNCVVFDNSKIKRVVPDYCATTSWAEGVRRALAWFNTDPARKQIDHEHNARIDKLIAAYERGMAAAVKEFAA
jgi:nucleoside-diphosphate-sugar epimerase